MKKTKNYAMPYPEQDDYFNVEDFQDMMVSVDDLMKKLSDSGAQISSDAEHLYNQTKAQMDNIQKRMNAFTALKEGSTTGDAELKDIRVAYDGKEYGNAGEAVREQASDIHKALFGAGASIWSKTKSESTKYAAETKGISILNERFTAAGVVAKISRGTFAENESTLNLDRECSAYIVEFEKTPGTVYMPSAETIKIVSTTKIIFEANGNARCWIPVKKGQYLAVDSTATAYTSESNHVPYMLYDQANKTLECQGFGSTGSIEPVDPYSLALEYKLEYDMDDTGLVKQIDANREDVASLKEDLGSLLHRPKEYWTMGDIDVPITGEWSNKQVKCEVDLSDMVGNALKVSVGSISDNIDTHRCFINLLDDQDINLSDGHVLEDTFPNHVITANGGYVTFDVSSIKNNVKYIKIQAQAYSGTKPTITGTIKYSDISAKDVSDKIAFIAEVNKSNLSNNLKNELHLSDSNGAVIKNVGTVNPDTTVTITSNNIKKNKTLIVNAKINSFEKITVGHGIDVYGGAYLEVTPSELSVYNYSTQAKLVKTVSHSLTIANDIYIEVTNSVSKYSFHARIKIVSQGQSFVQSGIFDFPWTGSNGDVFIKTGTNTALSDCKVSWSCSDLSANIHAFGDSYFDYWNPKIADLGYSDKFLFDGFGGRKTLQAIEPLKFCLEHGTPKYVLWCLGMNNPDIGGVNSDWLNGFNTVILACKNKGIIPIFATIPNTPKNNNSHKNAYIKSSGYRYVDIAHYVGADTANSNWYDGLLSSDKIHPTDKGAYIIAETVRKSL